MDTYCKTYCESKSLRQLEQRIEGNASFADVARAAVNLICSGNNVLGKMLTHEPGGWARDKVMQYVKDLMQSGDLQFRVYKSANAEMAIEKDLLTETPVFVYSLPFLNFQDDSVYEDYWVETQYEHEGSKSLNKKYFIPTLPNSIQGHCEHTSFKMFSSGGIVRIYAKDFASFLTPEDYIDFLNSVNKYNLIPKIDFKVYSFNEMGIEKLLEKCVEFINNDYNSHRAWLEATGKLNADAKDIHDLKKLYEMLLDEKCEGWTFNGNEIIDCGYKVDGNKRQLTIFWYDKKIGVELMKVFTSVYTGDTEDDDCYVGAAVCFIDDGNVELRQWEDEQNENVTYNLKKC